MLTVSALPVILICTLPETPEALSGRNVAIYRMVGARVGRCALPVCDAPHPPYRLARSANTANPAGLVTRINRASASMKHLFIVYSWGAGRTWGAHYPEVMGAYRCTNTKRADRRSAPLLPAKRLVPCASPVYTRLSLGGGDTSNICRVS